MIEETIFEAILKFIGSRFEQQELFFQEKKKEILDKILQIDARYNEILKYEEENRQELNNLCFLDGINDLQLFGRKNVSVFEFVLNDYGNWVENLTYELQNLEKRRCDHVIISYREFEEEIGLNSRSVKKYLHILEAQEKIKIKRVIGGLSYRIL